MEPGQFIGLLKFFRERWKLDALLDGTFYCNTPEFYRLSGEEGVGDFHESCTHAYRPDRGDAKSTLRINGAALKDILALTLHGAGVGDRWMHCWFVFQMPKDDEELTSLTNCIHRMRAEFGPYYALLPAGHVAELARRIDRLTEKPVNHCQVQYSNRSLDWSAECKPSAYSYQREYRFLIGRCPHRFLEPLVLHDRDGFRDLMFDTPELQIVEQDPPHVWFHLDSYACFGQSCA